MPPPSTIEDGKVSVLWFYNNVVPPGLEISEFEWLAACEGFYLKSGMDTNGFMFGKLFGKTIKLSSEYEQSNENEEDVYKEDIVYQLRMTRAEVIYV